MKGKETSERGRHLLKGDEGKTLGRKEAIPGSDTYPPKNYTSMSLERL